MVHIPEIVFLKGAVHLNPLMSIPGSALPSPEEKSLIGLKRTLGISLISVKVDSRHVRGKFKTARAQNSRR
jgi:hypothetical protein